MKSILLLWGCEDIITYLTTYAILFAVAFVMQVASHVATKLRK